MALGYTTTRDTSDARFSGENGRPKLWFAEDCRAAFRSAISRRNVEFVPGPVDHLGHIPADGAAFWLPAGPLDAGAVGSREEGWVRELAKHGTLRGAKAAEAARL